MKRVRSLNLHFISINSENVVPAGQNKHLYNHTEQARKIYMTNHVCQIIFQKDSSYHGHAIMRIPLPHVLLCHLSFWSGFTSDRRRLQRNGVLAPPTTKGTKEVREGSGEKDFLISLIRAVVSGEYIPFPTYRRADIQRLKRARWSQGDTHRCSCHQKQGEMPAGS